VSYVCAECGNKFAHHWECPNCIAKTFMRQTERDLARYRLSAKRSAAVIEEIAALTRSKSLQHIDGHAVVYATDIDHILYGDYEKYDDDPREREEP
jgi:DNA-directed RNA polymerase subunit RPC12/RpoP